MTATLDVIINWKGGKRPPAQKYEFIVGVALTTKGNTGGLRGYCYHCVKSRHMFWDCPEPKK